MRILLAHHTTVGALGGVEAIVETLATKFADWGHETAILEWSNLEPRPMPTDPRVKVFPVSYPELPLTPRSMSSYLKTVFQLRRAFGDFRPDIVNLHFPINQAPPMVGAANLPRAWRLVVTLHHNEFRTIPKQVPQLRYWHERLFAKADAITCVEETLRGEVAAEHKEAASKLMVIGNGVDLARFSAPRNEDLAQPIVLFAGRLHFNKGLDVLLYAWETVSRRFPNARLVFAGAGDELEPLSQIVEFLGLSKNVEFIGRVGPERLVELLKACTVFVLPSRNEAHPVVLNEAMAAGCACIATPVLGAALLPHDWRLVVTLHGSDLRRYEKEYPQLAKMRKVLFDKADTITVVEPTLRDELLSLYPKLASKTVVVPNGAGVSLLSTPGGREVLFPYVLYAGRMHPIKGVDVLLEAWSEVHTRAPGVRLVLAGDGEELERLRQLALKKAPPETVLFLGRVDQARLAGLVAHSDLFVLPSRSEAHPMALTEAMAGGAVCVATDVGGVSEVVGRDGSAGRLAPPEDPAALAEAILWGLRLSADERELIGKNARRRVLERFTWERVVDDYSHAFGHEERRRAA